MVRCSACGFHHVNPEPGETELLALYDAEYSGRHDLTWHGLEDELNRRVIRDLLRRGVHALTDLGAGQGRFVHLARQAGIDAVGVEPSPLNCAAARARYGLELIPLGVRQFLATRPAGLECITMLNVLEHVPGPLTALRALHEALRPAGTLAVVVPNVDFSLALARLRRAARFRDVYMLHSTRFSQQGFDPPIHLSSFDARHLRIALESAGLRVEHLGQAPVIRSSNPIARLAKRTVAAAGRTIQLLSRGRIIWGYSLYAIARRP
ncbi:MAG TPA: class I SAM-dependent methyltransferase [Longimicrobiales bacterium]